MPEYKSGGLFTQVKLPKYVDFVRRICRLHLTITLNHARQKSYKESLAKPEFLISDFAKFDRPMQLHLGFQALAQFVEKNGRYPKPRNEQDANEVLAATKALLDTVEDKPELNEKLIKELAYQSAGEISPMVAVYGGLAAQEVLKVCHCLSYLNGQSTQDDSTPYQAVSGKFNPIYQFMYMDALEAMPSSVELSEELCAPVSLQSYESEATQSTFPLCIQIGSRYDGQIAVFGRQFQDKIANTKEFLVGAGAIGCEMLKNWAMMGLGVGSEGSLIITDMDTIEKSNLNRQFLFRPADVGVSIITSNFLYLTQRLMPADSN